MTSTMTEAPVVSRDNIGLSATVLTERPNGAGLDRGAIVQIDGAQATYYTVRLITDMHLSMTGPTWSVEPQHLLIHPHPVAGQEYVVNKDRPRNAVLRLGQKVTVDSPHRARTCAVIVRDESGQSWWVADADLSEEPGTGTSDEPAEAFLPDTVDKAEHDRVVARVAELEAEIGRLRTASSQVQTRWQEDIQYIGETLMQEAESRDWCSEYDEIVDRINGRIRYELPTREREITVSWSETYTVYVTRSATTTARNGDEAAREVLENCEPLGEYDLIELLRENGSHEYVEHDSDSVDWS